MIRRRSLHILLVVLPLTLLGALLPFVRHAAPAPVAEIGVLTDENYDALAPAGKEVDAIDGDYVLRNDRIVAVIGNPVPRRDANASLKGVGGAVIDLTVRGRQSDLLGVYWPGGGLFACLGPQMTVSGRPPDGTPRGEPGILQARQVMLTCVSPQQERRPAAVLTYTLGADDEFLTVSSRLQNEGERPQRFRLDDVLVAQGPSFDRAPEGGADLYWAYDRWFGQAYGLSAPGHAAHIRYEAEEAHVTWLEQDAGWVTLRPGESLTLGRRLFPASDSIALRAIEARQHGDALRPISVEAVDSAGEPVDEADVAVTREGVLYGEGRTGQDGTLAIEVPAEATGLTVSSAGRRPRSLTLPAGGTSAMAVLDGGTRVSGRVTEAGGGGIPSKITFTGIDGTPTPDFGPKTAERAVRNLLYTPDGRFSRVLAPGSYQVLFSRGPEYDAVERKVQVGEGSEDVVLDVALSRSVRTPGWISADFHGHSTASGDTTASVAGRVLNLAAEGIEFAPCTEHNRLDTYAPHIHALGLGRFLATAVGLELTSTPFPLNHQNAFPLTMRLHTQGNGAPPAGGGPLPQIRRLAGWDGGSEKLVQQNHPDIGWMFYDADEDGHHDAGFGMIPYQDVIEVYGNNILKMEPAIVRTQPGDTEGDVLSTRENNRVFNWLQLLNQGVRLPGVANSDAHHNFHGSGGVRNYVKCATDDPVRIDPLDIVRSAERGHLVMTNGPYLDVSLREADGAGVEAAIPGDEIQARSGRLKLHVVVQCPDWFDIDRVQVLLNGRKAGDLGFTRYTHPRMFARAPGPVRFDRTLDVVLKGDAHLIVVAANKVPLGPVMGPGWGIGPPVAISNPIFVDVDGGGFQANGDTLDHPLPVKLLDPNVTGP